ncbi:integral membrane protein S linking to the trans Golgi network-domain-containing protein [Cokeromyces recurvatus]|uniref:integral membrane protein S linking to the trans Golgi network-domain-containing protein n=1 Tax=Cokeromyces recurvatus TaxID=90255 RepID=UPI00221F9069|nr:integral membrane protein S linking to the trans Golgi network-domain-containing protein [Cokeromyces recurvatus]KAI7898519.1 integral membrane protein S linking to the trans Golgi network-domain-containing protein [Cokeromyces recurvatus]
MATSTFRASKWDPIYIIAQIMAVQSLCYISFTVVLLINLTLSGTDVSLDLLFDPLQIRTDTGFGWSLIAVWLINALLSIPILTIIVQRAKQILDYVLTFHFFHLLGCWYRVAFPTNGTWWLLQIVTIIIMTFGGEWACMHREMKPILISSTTETAKRKDGQQGPLLLDKVKNMFNKEQNQRYDQIPLNDIQEGASGSRS